MISIEDAAARYSRYLEKSRERQRRYRATKPDRKGEARRRYERCREQILARLAAKRLERKMARGDLGNQLKGKISGLRIQDCEDDGGENQMGERQRVEDEGAPGDERKSARDTDSSGHQ